MFFVVSSTTNYSKPIFFYVYYYNQPPSRTMSFVRFTSHLEQALFENKSVHMMKYKGEMIPMPHPFLIQALLQENYEWDYTFMAAMMTIVSFITKDNEVNIEFKKQSEIEAENFKWAPTKSKVVLLIHKTDHYRVVLVDTVNKNIQLFDSTPDPRNRLQLAVARGMNVDMSSNKEWQIKNPELIRGYRKDCGAV